MNVRNLILTGAIALAGIVATGCNENPTDTPPNDAPTDLQATSLSATEVGLRWNAPAGVTGASYVVEWTVGGVTQDTSTSATMIDLGGLTEGVEYTFSVTTMTTAGEGGMTSIVWSPASRHTQTNLPGQLIRMYEFESDEESGLNLSVNGKPTRVTLNRNATGQPLAQLAMYIGPRSLGRIDSVIIGPVYAIPEYKISAAGDFSRMDTNVFISAQTQLTPSLDEWYLSAPLNTMIAAASNVMAYTFIPATTGGNPPGGHGFIVRTGTNAANYHYARVLIRPIGPGGVLVGGSHPNRYVELEISYQNAAGIPYAKGTPNKPGVTAKKLW